jgi:hypothetical protein
MGTKKRSSAPFMPSDNRYDKPFKYVKQHRAYVVTLQKKTSRQPGLYDVVPEHGDRAVPKGVVRAQPDGSFEAFLYHPAFSADLLMVRPIDDFAELDAAVVAILDSSYKE